MAGEDATSGDDAMREAETEELSEERIGMSNDQGPDERVIEADDGDVQLLEELVRLRQEADEARERHVRLLAEFDNFRRRSMRERSELVKYQGEQIVIDLLDVIDNVERAMGYADGDPGQFRGGVELIFRNFQDLLEKWGVRLESAIGKEFNPSYQSALSIVPTPNSEPGTVVNELKKAAFYKDKLIRVGEVVVAGQSGSPQED